ncbi:helix-turn-helix domain-containing protein [Streptomyces albidoflavus]
MGGFAFAKVETRDPDVMADLMTSGLGFVDMSVIDPKTAYFSMESTVSGALSTLDFELSFRGAASLDALEQGSERETYSIVYVDKGFGRLWNAREEALDVYRTVLYPDWVGSEFDGCSSKVVSINRAVVRDYARRLAGTDALEVRFTGFEPRISGFGAQWVLIRRHLIEAIRVTADNPQLRLIRDSLQDVVAATVLSVFPNTLGDHLDRHDAHPIGPTPAVRRAMTYIDEHLHEPVSLADIVGASGMTVRGLQSAFRRTLDMSPMEYLRRARLSRARDDLILADPSRTTVAEIGRRWGFLHQPRFAAAYREEFGEYPHETLQR